MYFKRLIPWSRLLEKPKISQLDNKYPAFYGNRIQYALFLVMPSLASNLSQMNPVHVIPSFYIKSILIFSHIAYFFRVVFVSFPRKPCPCLFFPYPSHASPIFNLFYLTP